MVKNKINRTDLQTETICNKSEENVVIPQLAKYHPCYNEKAHFKISRLHLPVAPSCNIYCNYCDRRISHYYHTSRPGIASEIIKPEKALEVTLNTLKTDANLKVVGIAGPGEPLFNPETFETLKLIHNNIPELQLCVCTNGLLLPEKLDQLLENEVTSITVTLNAVDPVIAGKIYHHIDHDGERITGRRCGEIIIQNQLDGISAAVKRGALVKINTVLIPAINFDHIIDIARKASELGVYIMNIMPLIPLGKFAHLAAPTCDQLKLVRIMAETEIPQFRLCKQCRADAYGIPGFE